MDINPVDFRAWYGLGQTYEFLLQPHFALYYYKQAVKIRCALGWAGALRICATS